MFPSVGTRISLYYVSSKLTEREKKNKREKMEEFLETFFQTMYVIFQFWIRIYFSNQRNLGCYSLVIVFSK